MNVVNYASLNWTCEHCTWVNKDFDIACTMCYITHSGARNLPFQWEWQPNPDQWIPYDKLSSAQIEAAYQAGLPNVTLTAGYFRFLGGRHILHMDHLTRKFEQENTSTRKIRSVRRIADDDNSILMPVTSIDAESICAICIEPFAGDGLTDVVRLPPCAPGHYFHRLCIAQAIKLRDRCPLCAKSVVY